MEANAKAAELLLGIRKKKPLVHHITNYVTANDCANITLAIGASPIMADDINEVQDITAMSNSLVINLGTLSIQRLESMLKAGKTASKMKIPIVLDSVGAGASAFRLEAAVRVIHEANPTVVKGNISEIKALYGIQVKAKGVDAIAALGSNESEIIEAAFIAKELASKLSSIVVITGRVDIVTDGQSIYRVKNGKSIMSGITGTGCMCSSLIASYLGTGEAPISAALAGVVSMGVAGEIASERLDIAFEGTGSFRTYLIDAVSNLKGNDILKRGKICEV